MKKNIIQNIIILTFITAVSFSTVSPLLSLSKDEEAGALNIGKKLLYEGKIEAGIKTLEEAYGDGQNPNITYYLAKGYSWSGNFKKAIEYYKHVQILTGFDDIMYWQAQFGLAQVTSWQQEFDQAITMYSRILTDYKDIPVFLKRETYIAIGDVYSWMLEISRAIEFYNKALEDDPESVDALNNIAKVHLWSKNYKEAKRFSQKVLEIDKNNIEAKNRIESLDLLWNYSVTLGDTLTLFDSRNTKGEKVKRNSTLATFDWPVRDNFGLHFESSYVVQNSVETSDVDEASKWTGDINAGLGINGKVLENTYYSGMFNYTFDAKILPDWTGEAGLNRKISKDFDVLASYKLYYDSRYKDQRRESPMTHSVSLGWIYYISELVYSQLQFFFDTDGKDRLFSVLFHQTFSFTSSDKVDVYLSYGKGMNYLVYPGTTVPVDVTTMGISFSYVHFFSTRFGIKPTIEYHDRVNYYSDISFGVQGIYNI